MTKGSGVSYLHERLNPSRNASVDAIVDRLKKHCISMVLDGLGAMFDGIDDSFFELANHAHSNNEQNRFFETMREVRIKRKGIENHIQNALSHAFEHPKALADQQSADTMASSVEELSLVQNDALEESVAVDSMITKAKANYAGSLMHFQTRFSSLVSGEASETLYNPLDPVILCRAFQEACAGLEISIKEKLIVFKQFDRHVMEHIVEPLDAGNQLLANAGVLPDLKYTTYKNKVRNPQREKRVTRESLEQEPLQNFPSEQDVFAQAQELLASLRSPQHTMQGNQIDLSGATATEQQPQKYAHIPLHSTALYQGPPLNIGSPELQDMLSDIQRHAQAEDLTIAPPTSTDLRRAIQVALDRRADEVERPTQIKQVDEDLINLVAMLFEFILDDYNLSAPIQVLISRLQIPILKVALKDKGFFSKPSHPARKLLNALAKASVGWSDSSEKAKDKLYSRIHDIVRQVLEDDKCDLDLYERLHEEFSQYLAGEERKSKLVEQRTKEAEIGRVKSQKARLVVDKILYEKISVTAIPQVALDLLKSGWSRVMFLVYLKEGKGHRFSQCVKVVDELVWCLQPHTEEEARKRWVQVAPKLLKNLKIGLREISYNAGRLDELLIELKKELTSTFKQQSAASAKLDMPKLADLKATLEAAEQKNAPVHDASLYEYLEQIDKLQSGDWVEFALVNGSRFRCKFSTSIEENNSLIFVNRMGLKVVEKSRVELADELRKGQLVILQSGMLMDRAIDAVMQNLKRMSDKVA